jgi:hypothetical protein
MISGSFTQAFMKLTALLLLGFLFIAFSTTHSPRLSRSIRDFLCRCHSWFSYIWYSRLPKVLTADSLLLQISFTYTRNRNGPNTLLYGTPDVNLTSSDNCPPTLTLCE